MEYNEIPYFALGNNELIDKLPIGKTTNCPNCNKKHKVEYGKDAKTGEVSKLLGFVHCKKSNADYLVAVNQKNFNLIPPTG